MQHQFETNDNVLGKVCKICKLTGGSLTTECPGEESYLEHGDTVYNGMEDYVKGGWVYGVASPHSPKGRKRILEESYA